jgi:hypothetical protein
MAIEDFEVTSQNRLFNSEKPGRGLEERSAGIKAPYLPTLLFFRKLAARKPKRQERDAVTVFL